MNRFRFEYRMLAAVLVAALFGCAREQPKNVLLITVDTLRADHVGAYGYAPARTPVMDALAEQGVRFDEVSAAAPITMPSHASIMTGLLPPAHSVRDNGAFALPDTATTLAERLRDAGYDTAAFVSAVVLSRRYGIDQGFAHYDDELWNQPEPPTFMIRERRAQDTVDRVLRWLDARQGERAQQPYFLWVHLFDPHQPYHAPATFALRGPTPYDAEIAYADHEIGRLIEELRATDQLDDTLVVLTADHGESLGEHQEKTHAVFVYRATTRVPLILRHPGSLPTGHTIATPVHSIDIAPTVLAALGLSGAEAMQGRDLAPLIAGKAAGAALPRYSESKVAELGFGMAPLAAIRDRDHTYIRAPKPELYDLKADPGETTNLHGSAATEQLSADLDVALQLVLDDSARRALAPSDNPMSRETLEMLQSLGYLQGERERAAVAGMDPKDGIVIYNLLEDARHAVQRERWDDAERMLGAILEQVPAHFSARSVLALVYLRTQRLAQARAEYRRLIADDPKQFRLYGMLGLVDLYEGDIDAAENSYRAALAVAPDYAEAMGQLGLIALLRDDEAGAQAWYDRARAVDPGFPTIYRRLGDLRYGQGDFAGALEHYRAALARQNRDVRAMVQAGNSARRLGDWDGARDYFERALALDEDNWAPAYNLACLHAVQGRADEAIRYLDLALQRGFDRARVLREDPDWAGLRADSRYEQRLKELTRAARRAQRGERAHADGVREDD